VEGFDWANRPPAPQITERFVPRQNWNHHSFRRPSLPCFRCTKPRGIFARCKTVVPNGVVRRWACLDLGLFAPKRERKRAFPGNILRVHLSREVAFCCEAGQIVLAPR
jgi:hypothetical protein